MSTEGNDVAISSLSSDGERKEDTTKVLPGLTSDGERRDEDTEDPTTIVRPVLRWDKAMTNLATAQWLRVSDNLSDMREQFINENVNVSLVSALFVTVAHPSIYDYINLGDDGWFFDDYKDEFYPDALHDAFLFGFFLSECFFIIGTIMGVFYAMAANECGNDAKTKVLVAHLGPWAQLPYYCFSIGIIFYATPLWGTILVLPKSVITFIVAYVVLIILLIASVLISMPRMVQGVYLGDHLAKAATDVTMTEKQLQDKLAEITSKGTVEVTLTDFLEACIPHTPQGYSVPLSDMTKVRAVKVFTEHIAKILGISHQESLLYYNAAKDSGF